MRKFIAIVIGVTITVFLLSIVNWAKFDSPEPAKETPESVSDDEECDVEEYSRMNCYIKEKDPDRLAYWFPYHDSLNHMLTSMAEELWLIDSVAERGNNRSRRIWYDKCTKMLIHGFDSIHTHSNISNYAKADSMLTEIEKFFDRYQDYSTVGMMLSFDLEYKFLMYRMTALSFQICEKNFAFEEEIKVWGNLEKAVRDFCMPVIHLGNYGGSIVGPKKFAMRNTIIECRINDLKRIHKLYSKPSVLQLSNNNDVMIKEAEENFKKAVEKIASSIDINDAKEYLSEESFADYKSLYDKVQKSKEPLIKSLDKWLAVRMELSKYQSDGQKAVKNGFKENTVMIIDSLTKCILYTEKMLSGD